MENSEKLLESLQKVISSNEELEKKALYFITNIVYTLESDLSLYTFAKILNEEQLIHLMDIMGGNTIKIPNKKEYLEKQKLAIIYYLKKIKEMEWKEIYKFFEDHNSPISDNTIILGKRMVKIDEHIQRLSKDITN